MLVERPKDPMQATQEREEEALEDYDGPRPVSNIGAGRGGLLMSFTQGVSSSSGR